MIQNSINVYLHMDRLPIAMLTQLVVILVALSSLAFTLKCYRGITNSGDIPTVQEDCIKATYCVKYMLGGTSVVHRGCDEELMCEMKGEEVVKKYGHIKWFCCNRELCNFSSKQAGFLLVVLFLCIRSFFI
ncbi:hypothetical protein RB195_009819 [Necator americanus]|uniref:Activin types I and II receptor domain-containing protein n=1 Tax=Necator americanus TaxID=51031 RepID=A0ABR1CV20_NECAM